MANNEYLFDNFDIFEVLDKEMLSPLEILSAEQASDTMTTSSPSTEARNEIAMLKMLASNALALCLYHCGITVLRRTCTLIKDNEDINAVSSKPSAENIDDENDIVQEAGCVQLPSSRCRYKRFWLSAFCLRQKTAV